jgi:formylglycine-generating enzyme required for sulfatase activity
VPSGTVCVDKYEASVWETTTPSLIVKIKAGTVTLTDLISDGAIQHGVASDDYNPGCPDNGNNCTNFYAVSIPGVIPSTRILWFQAAAACRNAGKRLLTNAEWQVAALGTPDLGTDNEATDCNIATSTGTLPEDPVNTGSRSSCVSDVGAFDMVGNVWEWVADWGPQSTTCPGWDGFSDDLMCLAGANTTAGPGTFLRGGSAFSGPIAPGVLALDVRFRPLDPGYDTGLRCGR